jgi:hypothetical protein
MGFEPQRASLYRRFNSGLSPPRGFNAVTVKVTKHKGILHCFWISRRECDGMIAQARKSAGWIK